MIVLAGYDITKNSRSIDMKLPDTAFNMNVHPNLTLYRGILEMFYMWFLKVQFKYWWNFVSIDVLQYDYNFRVERET